MKAETKREGNKLVITVGEAVNAVNAPELKALVEEAADGDVMEMVFDVTDMPYTSSAGLRVFLASQNMMDDRGGRLELTGVSGSVKDILTESGFITFMNYSTAE